MLFCGCSQDTAARSAPRRPVAAWNLAEAPLDAALTSEDVSVFLAIMNTLPELRDAEFSPKDFPQLAAGQGLASSVAQLRTRCRETLEPTNLARRWLDDLVISQALRRESVPCESFASLAVRTSCAWQAAALGEARVISVRARELDRQIDDMTRRLEQPSKDRSAWDLREQLKSLEDAVALSEFLRVLAAVPDSSRTAVLACRQDLERLLPAASGPSVAQRSAQVR